MALGLVVGPAGCLGRGGAGFGDQTMLTHSAQAQTKPMGG